MVTGKFVGMSTDTVNSMFGNLCGNPTTLILFSTLICLLAFFILSFSLKGGLERFTKYMMIALLIIMIVIAIKGFSMKGAREGLQFYLVPDFTKINIDVIVGAMNRVKVYLLHYL